jgi:hypothetical protein
MQLSKPLIFLFLLFTLGVNAQDYFEGQIDYKVEYESLNEDIPSAALSYVMGKSFTAYVKEDKYVMIHKVFTASGYRYSITRLDEGYHYLYSQKEDTIFRSKLSENKNKLLEIKKLTDAPKEVLGEMCTAIYIKEENKDPSVPFTIQEGLHYYNPKYKLNAAKYSKHQTGFWNEYARLSESISIRNEHHYPGFFKSTSYAIKIEAKPISDDLFELPKDKVIVDAE